ncbi:MAG: chemotaxis-specific protein-glutamate methyltransferase CheB [Gammaproteobacteria bacterium]|nr:chemotaxis-specific protein-glutamate methyltransferase CheB [Gammaproteobacteria bacterium]
MKVAIINNKQQARKELIRIVTMTGEHELAWSTSSGKSAIRFCMNVRPDLILMDPMVRDIDGIAVIRQIMAETPCAILIVTRSIDDQSEIVFSAMGAGAIDAVNTPILDSREHNQAVETLRRKIALISVLVRDIQALPVTPMQGELSPAFAPAEKNLVAIGCSSGGPEALAEILSQLPHDFQSPIVVIQHVDAAFAPGLAKWLNVKSALPVELAKDGDLPTPGKVYLAATNYHMMVSPQGRLVYSHEPADTSYRPSVDVFFKSVAENWRYSATAILLTGMGKDGAKGLKELREKGAYTIAQDKATSAVYGMPKAALEMDAAVDVLPINKIAGALIRITNTEHRVLGNLEFQQ